MPDAPDASARPKIFVSYAHTDKEWLERMNVHLKPLERTHNVELWTDQKIGVGKRWLDEIQNALDESQVAVLLVSAHFLASDFIADGELPPLLQKAEQEGTRIMPVIVGSCDFRGHPDLGAFQSANDPEAPLQALSAVQVDQVFVKLKRAIEEALAEQAALDAAAASGDDGEADADVDAGGQGGDELDDWAVELEANLEALLDGDDVAAVKVYAHDGREGVALLAFGLAEDDDGALRVLLEVAGNAELPAFLQLSPADRQRMARDFAVVRDRDPNAAGLCDCGPIDEAEASQLRDLACALLEQFFGLPTDEVGIASEAVPG